MRNDHQEITFFTNVLFGYLKFVTNLTFWSCHRPVVGCHFEPYICNIVCFATINFLHFSSSYMFFPTTVTDEILQNRANIMTQCYRTCEFQK